MRGLGIAAALAVAGVFAAIAISVVRSRDPQELDRAIEHSFAVSLSRLASVGYDVESGGCEKRSLDYYDCAAVVRVPGRPRASRFEVTLWLRNDDCWDPYVFVNGRPRAASFPLPPGCIIR